MCSATFEDMVRLLLSKGADVKARSQLGNNAIILAARSTGNSRTVKLLLDWTNVRIPIPVASNRITARQRRLGHASCGRLIAKVGSRVKQQELSLIEAFDMAGVKAMVSNKMHPESHTADGSFRDINCL